MKNNYMDDPAEKYPSCISPRDCFELEAELEELENAQEERVSHQCNFKIAKINDACQEKIQEFEHELNKQGYWNIALVAYQKD